MAEWTIERVGDRFEEAAATAHSLPAARVRGYVSCWPDIVREGWEGYAETAQGWRPPPAPDAIDRWAETTRWLQWLDEEQRHLVWSRARYVPWRAICERFGCSRKTAHRRWHHALLIVVVQLNGLLPGFAASPVSELAQRDAG